MDAATTECNRAFLTFASTVSFNKELHIRHGSALVLRNLNGLVTDQLVTDPLIRRPFLEVLGLEKRPPLAAATDMFSEAIGVEGRIGSFTEKGDGRVSRVMEGALHDDGGEEREEEAETQGEWFDIGRETREELEQALSANLSQETSNGISEVGLIAPERLLNQHREKVLVRYNGGTPARARPLELRITERVYAIHAKPLGYPPEELQLLRRNFINSTNWP